MEISNSYSTVEQKTHLGDSFIINRNQIRRLRVNLKCLVKAKGSLNIVGSCEKEHQSQCSQSRILHTFST